MESGALGCEILLKGKLRSDRGRYEKVVDGYIPKAGDPAQRYVRRAVIHVKQKKGTFGITVVIVPPDAKFPDKVDLSGLPVIEYPEEEIVLPAGVEPDAVEGDAVVGDESPEPVEALEPTAALEPTEGEAEATPVEAAETVEPVEIPEPEVETPAKASEPETEVQPEETKAKSIPDEAVADLQTVAEEPETVPVLTPVEEAPIVDPPVNEEAAPVEEASKAVEVEGLVADDPREVETSEIPEANAIEEPTPVEETPEVETPEVEEATPVEEAPVVEEVEAPVESEAVADEKSPEPSEDSETKKEE
jgi:hypothetical protein